MTTVIIAIAITLYVIGALIWALVWIAVWESDSRYNPEAARNFLRTPAWPLFTFKAARQAYAELRDDAQEES